MYNYVPQMLEKLNADVRNIDHDVVHSNGALQWEGSCCACTAHEPLKGAKRNRNAALFLHALNLREEGGLWREA